MVDLNMMCPKCDNTNTHLVQNGPKNEMSIFDIAYLPLLYPPIRIQFISIVFPLKRHNLNKHSQRERDSESFPYQLKFGVFLIFGGERKHSFKTLKLCFAQKVPRIFWHLIFHVHPKYIQRNLVQYLTCGCELSRKICHRKQRERREGNCCCYCYR